MHGRFFHARELLGSLEPLMEMMNHNETSDAGNRGHGRNFFALVSEAFHQFAHRSAALLGTAWAFVVAALIILVWGVTGPTFHFSDTWQLIINTGTTIVTFLMVFLIQNTQNRDAKAVHLKLDELIRAMKGARNRLVDLEKLSDDELQALEQEFQRLHQESREDDTHVVEIAPKR
ncbi:MAG: low affinity iron permease family protein [Chthoniobacterales bacterium]